MDLDEGAPQRHPVNAGQSATDAAVWVRGPDPSLRKNRAATAAAPDRADRTVDWVPMSSLGSRTRGWAADRAVKLADLEAFGRRTPAGSSRPVLTR